MTDPVFDAVMRRDLHDTQQALVEALALVAEFDEDDPLEDRAAYVTSPAAQRAARRALEATTRPAVPVDRTAPTVEALADQLLAEGDELERAARELSGPDYVHAHQGRALGLIQAGHRLGDLLARLAERVPA